MPINPYGAKVAAMRETRLTLRDIMKDLLATKIQAKQVDLARTQMEVERAGVELEGEKMKAASLADMAKAKADQEHRGKLLKIEGDRDAATADYRTRQLKNEETRIKNAGLRDAATARHRTRQLENQGKQIAIAGDRAKAEAERLQFAKDEKKRMREIVPADKLADEVGLMPTQKELFIQMFPNGVSREQALKARDDMVKDPATFYRFVLIGNIDGLERMQQVLQDPQLTGPEREQLQAQFDDLLHKTERTKKLVDWMNQGKTRFTAKDIKEVKEDLRYTWDNEMDETMRAEFKNDYKKFEKAGIKDFQEVIKAGSLGLEEFKDGKKKKKTQPGSDLAPSMKKQFTSLLNQLRDLYPKDEVASIEKNVRHQVLQGNGARALGLLQRMVRLAEKNEPARESGEKTTEDTDWDAFTGAAGGQKAPKKKKRQYTGGDYYGVIKER